MMTRSALWTAVVAGMFLFGLAVGPVRAADLGAPQAVSPGVPGAAEPLAESCPTFSWSGVGGATGYELVLYRVSASGDLETALQTRVPGDARSWTPSAAECPTSGSASGNQYAWVVRGLDEDGAGAWSQPLQFATPGMPTEDEVRQALATLRRYQAGREADAGEGLAPSRARSEDATASSVSTPSGTEARRYPGGPTTQSPEPTIGRVEDGALSAPTVGAAPSPVTVTTPSAFSLNLSGDVELGGFVFKEGVPFIHNDGGAAFDNTAVGLEALQSVTPGSPSSTSGIRNTAFGEGALRDTTQGLGNTATGFWAMLLNESGSSNTAVGNQALLHNTSGFANTAVGSGSLGASDIGHRNTAVGVNALRGNVPGDSTVQENTAVGVYALFKNENDANTALGYRALFDNTQGHGNFAAGWRALEMNETGIRNTAVGGKALQGPTSASYNVAIGYKAGYDFHGIVGYNIAIGAGAYGLGSHGHTIVIGGNDKQSQTFIEGIFGATASGGTQVFINSDNQLGTSTSSARFKQDIHDLEGVSDRLLDLRPVSFRYKDDPNPLEYGLIAEEVAEIFPELVLNDEEGRPYTVRYHLLTPLLLGEIQRQEGEIEGLRRQMADRDRDYRKTVADLERRVEKLAKKRSWWRRGDG